MTCVVDAFCCVRVGRYVSGRVAFHGSTVAAVAYLAGLGYQCPTYFNPADFVVNCLQRARYGELEPPCDFNAMWDASDMRVSFEAASTSRAAKCIEAAAAAKIKTENSPDGGGGSPVGRPVGGSVGPTAADAAARRRQPGGDCNGAHPAGGRGGAAGAAALSIKEEEERDDDDNWDDFLEGEDRGGRVSRSVRLDGGWGRAEYSTFAVDARTQVWYTLQRAVRNFSRHSLLMKARLGQTVFFGFLSGCIWINLGDDLKSIQDRNGLMFFCTLNQMMLPLIGSVLTFPLERRLFVREKAAGFYSAPSYFFAKSLAEFPFQVLFPFIFSVIVYNLSGLRGGAGNFFSFALVLIVNSVVAQSWGLVVGAASGSPEIATLLIVPIMVPFIMVGGLFSNRERFDPYFLWLEKISPIPWAYESLTHIEYDGRVIGHPDAADGTFRGEDILNKLSIQGSRWRGVSVLAGHFVILRTLMLFLLWRAK